VTLSDRCLGRDAGVAASSPATVSGMVAQHHGTREARRAAAGVPVALLAATTTR